MTLNQESKKWLKVLVELVVVVGVAIVAVLAVHYIVPKDNIPSSPSGINQPSSSVTDYLAKDQLPHLVLIGPDNKTTNSVNRVAGGRNTTTQHFTGKFTVHGTIVGGYLYAVGDVGGKKFNSFDKNRLDDIFIDLTDISAGKEHAGHLVASKTLDTPPSDTQTEVLYALSSVSVIADYLDPDNDVTTMNWLPYFTDGKKFQLQAFVSTYKPSGTIDQLVIYYQCLAGTSCSITAD